MSPQYYADLFRRYRTYIRNFGDNRIYVIACGANSRNYHWTEVLMRESKEPLDGGASLGANGLSLHYYCGSGDKSRSATQFGEEDWFHQLKKGLFMDELITKHEAIMDKYDPGNGIGLMVDEWGTWHAVEPGTNRRFLYQQNSLRDALVAAVTLNTFNHHCRRVKMANIAQTINVLQAMLLTSGEKMVLTPSYHVFEMYKVHHDATLLPTRLLCNDYCFGDAKIPALNVSASLDKAGRIHISICNLDPNNSARLICEVLGAGVKKVAGRVLTADAINAHNTFDNPETVKPAKLNAVTADGNTLTATLPAKSVVVLEMQQP
jgi:alpha-N-arabinofuranosidase